MTEVSLLTLFFTFFKIGLFTFGGGYAMLPFIQQEATKVCLVKAMVFPVVMYGCESWTVKNTAP